MSRYSTLKPDTPRRPWFLQTAIFLALALALPAGLQLADSDIDTVFLPMQIPVLLAGFLAGPLCGLIVGLLAPGLALLVPGVPLAYPASLMALELSLYGFIAGLAYCRLKMNIYVALMAAMIVGRGLFTIGLAVSGLYQELPMTVARYFSSEGPLVSGMPGIVLQIFLVPFVVAAIRRRRS